MSGAPSLHTDTVATHFTVATMGTRVQGAPAGYDATFYFYFGLFRRSLHAGQGVKQ